MIRGILFAEHSIANDACYAFELKKEKNIRTKSDAFDFRSSYFLRNPLCTRTIAAKIYFNTQAPALCCYV